MSHVKTYVEAGSGSLPTEKIPSIAITIKSDLITTKNISNNFLNNRIPIVGYINNDIFHIDFKAIPDDQIDQLIKIINKTLK